LLDVWREWSYISGILDICTKWMVVQALLLQGRGRNKNAETFPIYISSDVWKEWSYISGILVICTKWMVVQALVHIQTETSLLQDRGRNKNAETFPIDISSDVWREWSYISGILILVTKWMVCRAPSPYIDRNVPVAWTGAGERHIAKALPNDI
jgi:hypothetical protein